jgi:hypothetical protein
MAAGGISRCRSSALKRFREACVAACSAAPRRERARKSANSRMRAYPSVKTLTFGEFVAGVYRTWGERRAKGIIQLAIKLQVVKFVGADLSVIS